MQKEKEVPCKICGSNNTYGVTRVVGYFSRINNWNNQKKGELKDRQRGDYGIILNPSKPLSPEFEDGIYLYSKAGCSNCEGQDRFLNFALKKAGLEGKIPICHMQILDGQGNYNEQALAHASMMDVPLSSLPAVAIVSKHKRVFMQPTIYENGKAARIVKPDTLVEQLVKHYAA